MKILVTIPRGPVFDTFLLPETIRRLEFMGEVTWNPSGEQFSPEAMASLLEDKDVCVAGWGTPCLDAGVMARAKALKILAYTGGSVAPVVSDAVYDAGVRVLSGNRIFAESVAEGVVAYMLAGLRNIPGFNREVHQGQWRWDGYYTRGLAGRTVGIVGFGMIAECLVRMLKPFGVKILVCSGHIRQEKLDQYGMEKAALEELLQRSDIVTLHASARPETKHMINREKLALIRDGALLINTARGSLVDETALEDALVSGRFSAVLDVYSQEPLPAASRLCGLPNAILLPHMAGPTTDRRNFVTQSLLDDVCRWKENSGPLQNKISKEYAGVMTR